MQRIAIIGSSGAGKSTLARELGRRLSLPHLELDSLFHQADWQPLAREQFETRIDDFVAGPGWVVDGNYVNHGAGPRVWKRADTILWLDLPRATVMRQLIGRTLVRGMLGTELWNGNREQLRSLLKRDPEENVVLWSFTQFHHIRERYALMARDGTWAGLSVYRLRSRREIEDFLHTRAAAVRLA
ncbi:MAG: (d)CMP kinase [Myxococcales bacterium]|nr:(d)CMP kinase [Myxococcales bacterium]